MRTLILFIGLSLFCVNVHAQQIYFGYPISKDEIKQEDKMILNLPFNLDGRFNSTPELDKLVEFLNEMDNFVFRIEIHYFYGSNELAESYSKFLCKNLEQILQSRCEHSNYKLQWQGKSCPIFLNKDDKKYNEMNTRIEILVEKQISP